MTNIIAIKSNLCHFCHFWRDLAETCLNAWNEPNSIPKWAMCYTLMSLSVYMAFAPYGAIY